MALNAFLMVKVRTT